MEPANDTPPEGGRARREPELGTVRGRPFDEVKAMTELPPPEHGVLELIWSDYCVHYERRQESERTRRLLFLPRLLVNSSMHANVLVRLIQGTPPWTTWLWRRLLIALHGCDFHPYCRIGPGLRMPHPVGIMCGFGMLGRNVVLQHHVTISPITSDWRTGTVPGLVHLGDEVTVFTGSVIAGQIAVGDRSVIGANSLVVRDIPAGHMVIAGRARPATEAELRGY